MRAASLLVLAVTIAVGLAGCSREREARDGSFRLDKIVDGLDQPVFVTSAPGDDALYILEQRGRILRWDGGAPDVFLDMEDRVNYGGERGLLGLAFQPDYATSGVFFVHYTDKNSDTALARVTANPAAHAALAASLQVILTVDDPYPNHNGGSIEFGPDGYLYMGLGDGGSGGDPQNRAQDKETLMGKILRLDVDRITVDQSIRPTAAYGIPPDNPFVGRAGRDEIWAFGLRNPWRFSFDRDTGDLWIGDVGQDRWEEIDFQPADSDGGENYGWSAFEGSHRYDESRQAPGAIGPVAEYANSGDHCSVTGGYVYRGSAVNDLQGAYLYGDYCSGVIWVMEGKDGASRLQLDSDLMISSFGQDNDGELYVVNHEGSVYKIVAA